MRDHFMPAARASGDARPLRGHIESFAEHVAALGFAQATIRSQLLLMRAFEQWLARHHVPVRVLDEAVVDRFLDAPRLRRRRQRGSASTLARFLTYLRAQGAIVSPMRVADDSPRAQVERRYHHYLRAERGLATTTVETYVAFCHQFLTEQLGQAESSVGPLSAAGISAFVRRQARAASPGRAKMMVTALRALFLFLFHTGELGVDLSAAVPTVPN